ncbi:MAG: ABC transporter substrate-binding protein [Akkermansia sp.]
MLKFISSLIGLILLGLLCAAWAIWAELSKDAAWTGDAAQPQTHQATYPDGMRDFLANLQEIDVKISPERELPSNLTWQDGGDEPEIGDPAALKGGSMRIINAGPFPMHLRPFGGVQLSFFNFTLYKNVELQLVGRHPSTGNLIPALAEKWSIDGRKVYFQLNPKARYSNGQAVRAQDFLLGIYLRCSPYAKNPFELSALQQRIEAVESIGEHTLSVTLRENSLIAPYLASELLHADEPSFYAAYGPDYVERYRNRPAPTTGGYTLHPKDIIRGRQLTLSRVKDWWAKDLPYYRNSCNVDSIEINFLSDEAQLWEFFLNKRIDFIQSRNVSTWQERTECPAVWKGQIEKRIFKANYPMPPYGIYFNCATLPELKLRQGIMAAMDMDAALHLIFRGEAERLSCFSDGYGQLTPKDIPQSSYQPDTARQLFHEMGYKQVGKDGILLRPDGTRLSVTLHFTPSDKITTLVHVLCEQARAAGLEIIPSPGPWQKTGKMVESKQYQLAFWADVAASPLPKLRYLFHSQHLDTYGKNLHSVADAQLDRAIEEMEGAQSMTALAKATRAANLRIAELAIWCPGWKENTAYIANWRHVRFPDTLDCIFAPPSPYEVLESHLYWIDPTYRSDGTYPEVDERIPSQYGR